MSAERERADADVEAGADAGDAPPPAVEAPSLQRTIGPVQAESMAHGGEALAREADGRVVFVSGLLPGEQVAVAPSVEHKGWARGVVVDVPTPPSPARIEPRCPHFGTWPGRGLQPHDHCGGCQWQHVDYQAQLTFKRDVLIDALRRLGGVPEPLVAAPVGMDEPWRYRNSLTTRLRNGRPALIALDGRTPVVLQVCDIAHPRVFELVEAFETDLPDGTTVRFRAATGEGADEAERVVLIEDAAVVVDEIDVDVAASVILDRGIEGFHVAAGLPFYVEQFLGRRLMVPAGSFFQTNTLMAEVLANAVVAAIPEQARIVVDLYCGVGTFTLAIADPTTGRTPPEAVWAVDDDEAAIGAALENAAGLESVTLLEGDAAEGLEHVGGRVDAVVVDPPRGGLSRAVGVLLARKQPRTIVYVSCEPATLARDVRHLLEAGYRLVDTQPIDVFPQTYHIESVSRLEFDG